jgi:general secretion pathway protein M
LFGLKLNNREKYAVIGAIACIVFFIVMQVLIFPMLDKRERLTRAIQERSTALKEMRSMKSEYQALQKQANTTKASLAKRKKTFSLFSFLDRLIGEVGIKENVKYMKPSTSIQKETKFKITTVELKLQAITMEQLTRYLHGVEHTDNNLHIKRMSISETGKPEGYIDVVMQVETFEI